LKYGSPLPWLCLAGLLALVPACDREPQPLQLADLTAEETLYIRRLMILERAKAVLMVDPPTGHVLLDSLAASWGDSAAAETVALVPRDPDRSVAVHELFGRIIEAETDSLLDAARPDRLNAPLPDPPPRLEPEEDLDQEI